MSLLSPARPFLPRRCSPGGVRRSRTPSRRVQRLSRWSAGSLLLLVLVVVVPGFVQLVGAQGPPIPTGVQFHECFRTGVDARLADPAAPVGRPSPPVFQTPGGILSRGVTCAHDFAQNFVVPTGNRILQGLSLILVVWTGIMFMFSGRFDFSQIINLIFLIGFATHVDERVHPGQLVGRLHVSRSSSTPRARRSPEIWSARPGPRSPAAASSSWCLSSSCSACLLPKIRRRRRARGWGQGRYVGFLGLPLL